MLMLNPWRHENMDEKFNTMSTCSISKELGLNLVIFSNKIRVSLLDNLG